MYQHTKFLLNCKYLLVIWFWNWKCSVVHTKTRSTFLRKLVHWLFATKMNSRYHAMHLINNHNKTSYILIYQLNFRTEANYIRNASSINRTEKINSFKGVSYPFVLYPLQLRQKWRGKEKKIKDCCCQKKNCLFALRR